MTHKISGNSCSKHWRSYRPVHCFTGWQPHKVECQSLCGSEVTLKIKQLEVEEARVPVPHSWLRQWLVYRSPWNYRHLASCIPQQ